MYRKNEIEAFREWGNGYYHFCTDGLKGRDFFYDSSDYATGTILLGLIHTKYDITIYAYSLMPNHIHIILSGKGGDCVQAFNFLRRKLNAMLKRNGRHPLPEDYWFKLEPIETREKMKNEIVYVLRNALEKGLGMACSYPWSSGWLYYSDWSDILNAVPACKVSQRDLLKRIGSIEDIPEDWLFLPHLGLNPYCFVDTQLVLKLFPEPKDLQTALVKDYETFFQIARRLGELSTFNRAEQESIVERLMEKRFGGRTLNQLSEEQKGQLAIILSREFGFTSYQIATTLFIKAMVIRQLLSAKELR